MNKTHFVLFLFILHTSYFILHPSLVLAQRFTSPSFVIDWGNFNSDSGAKTSPSFNLTDTVGQNAPGQYDSSGLQIKAGFQYIYDITQPFSFRISSLAINFGSLVPGIGSTASHQIYISSPAAHGYEILAAENHRLQQTSAISIPNTPGDNNLASATTSDAWNNATTYGFGFNALGIDANSNVTNIGTSSYFSGPTQFRQFADASSAVAPQVIMSETSHTAASRARITYKVNISATQTAGNYENAITYIAIPRY